MRPIARVLHPCPVCRTAMTAEARPEPDPAGEVLRCLNCGCVIKRLNRVSRVVLETPPAGSEEEPD